MGNRVKGRVKKKSIKAAAHSGMGSKRKLSRMGKKTKKDHSGIDATFVGRSSCLKRLQVSLKDFRRLCILKGIYPREPRGRAPSNKKGQVYYHVKDLKALAHEPLLQKFREFRAFMKKVRRAAGRNEKDEAARKDSYAPTYTLHHLVRERYPRFVDALSDLDDALALVYLFSALPSEGDIPSKVTNKAKSLSASWGAYCATTSAITKCFISVKGVYFEATIQNCAIRWVVPHSFTQQLPQDVDFKVMLTFFEFYESLLGFIMFKLYNDIGVRYPLPLTSADQSASSTVLSAHLNTLSKLLESTKGSVTVAVSESIAASTNDKNSGITSEKMTNNSKQSRRLMASVDQVLSKVESEQETEAILCSDEEDDMEVSAPLKAALESLAQDDEAVVGSRTHGKTFVLDDESTRRKRLFSGLTFFFSREVPKGYLELLCLSFGGKVGWEGDDSPISIKDPSITHHIVDRPALPSSFDHLPKSREYLQPQWIVDSANFAILLPCNRYAIGVNLPPHLSPWVNNDEEGYKPAYAKEIERLKDGEAVMDGPESEDLNDKEQENDNKGNVDEPIKRTKQADRSQEEMSDDEMHEVDEIEVDEKVKQKKIQEDEDAKLLARSMMNKKAARLYGRMQHGKARKQAVVENLQRKRKEIETKQGKTLDGKSVVKAKVERLKDERNKLLKEYGSSGGTMKRKRTK